MTKGSSKKDPFRLKLAMVMFCLILAAGSVVAKAFVLASLEADKLAELARSEYHQTVKVSPDRGLIYDRNGAELAVSVQVDSIHARPGLIKDRAKAAPALAKALGMDRHTVMKILNRRHPFVWVKRQVEPQVAEEVGRLAIEGVGITPESRRFYPYRQLAAHLLGFTGIDSNGLEGLEKEYEEFLKGKDGKFDRKVDARRRPIYISGESPTTATKGSDLVLTIDKRIQYLLERSLKDAVKAHGARSGMGLALVPATGEILASAAVPGYNPNVFSTAPPQNRRNRIITDPFEPGSTFKIFTLAAALEAGIINSDTVIDCEDGRYAVGANTIHDTKPHQKLKAREVLKLSSNIGAAKIGLALGPQRLHRRLTDFGFGKLSGVDLPGESRGLLAPPERWTKIDTANISFGQGVAVTAVQLAAAVGAVANKGLLMKPHLVKEIIGPEGRSIKRIQPRPVGRVVSPGTAAKLIKMMEGVVEEGGTGRRAALSGYRVAGKTGTAQKLDPAKGVYSNDHHLAVFVGLVPADDPALVLLVVVDEPQDSPFGGVVAAPVFASVAEQVLPLMGVASSESKRRWAKVIKSPRAGSRAQGSLLVGPAEKSRIRPKKAQRNRRMPQLVGLSMRDALRLVTSLGLRPEIKGSGKVVWQSPPGGRDLTGINACSLVLKAEAT